MTVGGRPITPPPAAFDPALDAQLRLEELVDRGGLEELCKSFLALFGIPVRIFSGEGELVANAAKQHDVCAYVNTLPDGRLACGAMVSTVKASDGERETLHTCFTGNAYRIFPVEYEGRRIGRLVLGPYLPPTTQEVPLSLLQIDRAIDGDRARLLLAQVPRATEGTVQRMAAHLRKALDLILFSGHKAMLTSQMHLMSVRESYHALEEKNRKLQEAFDRLRELDRLKSNFLATVSHELRTPLTSIIGYSEMLVEGIAGELSGDQREFVTTIQEKGAQLLALITSLLDLSKLESGSMTVRSAPVDVPAVMDQVISTLAPHARRKGVALTVRHDGPLPTLKGDGERIRQILLNLSENAIKFTPAHGSVELSARNLGVDPDDADATGFALLAPVQQTVEIRVADTGIGIPQRERGRVFDPFYQVDSSSTREYGGTGLGLSIVKRLVDAHHGTIHIEENAPQGTVFVVRLPTMPREG